MSDQIKVVAAESYPLVRTGIERIVIEQEDMKWLGEATSVSHASQICELLKPDILLLVPNLADYDPAESVLRVQSQCPTVKVLILSSCDKRASVQAALNSMQGGGDMCSRVKR